MKKFISIIVTLLALNVQAEVAPTVDDIRPLLNGKQVEQAHLYDADGKKHSLHGLLKSKPTVILAYRGGWCPYCNAQLGQMKEHEKKFIDLGYQVIAISPEPPETLKEAKEKLSGDIMVMSDRDGATMQALGIAYYLDAKTESRYKGMFGDRLLLGQNDQVILPAPAVYVFDQDNRVQFQYVNPNFRVRVHPEVVLTAAKLALK